MKPVVMILQIEGEKKKKLARREYGPDDIDADVEKCHEESETLEGITDEQDTDCSAFIGRDDLEHVEGDDADKHQGEYQEGPGRGESLEVMGVVEPDHEHGEADDDGNGEVDPKEDINERRVDETSIDGCLIVSEGRS